MQLQLFDTPGSHPRLIIEDDLETLAREHSASVWNGAPAPLPRVSVYRALEEKQRGMQNMQQMINR